jgi:hypothetical protein
MTAHEDIRDTSIAIMSTSALLLTILAVVHFASPPPPTVVLLTASGLYAATGIGAVVLLFVIISAREQIPHQSELTMKMQIFFLALQLFFFVAGLVGIYWIVLLASH